MDVFKISVPNGNEVGTFDNTNIYIYIYIYIYVCVAYMCVYKRVYISVCVCVCVCLFCLLNAISIIHIIIYRWKNMTSECILLENALL